MTSHTPNAMPPSSVPTTPSEVFTENARTIMDKATNDHLYGIEGSDTSQSQLSYKGITIEEYEKTFVAMTLAEANIIYPRQDYRTAMRTRETYDLLMRGKEDSDAPESLWWRERCWDIATHHSKYGVRPFDSICVADFAQFTVHRPPGTSTDIPLCYQTDVTEIRCPLVDEKPPDIEACSSAKTARVKRRRNGLPTARLQIEGSKSNLPPHSKMKGADFSLCSQEAAE